MARAAPTVPMKSIVTAWAGSASVSTGRAATTMPPRPAGCAWRSARPVAATACSSCRVSDRRCWCSFWKTTSIGRSFWARSTTARVKVLPHPRPEAKPRRVASRSATRSSPVPVIFLPVARAIWPAAMRRPGTAAVRMAKAIAMPLRSGASVPRNLAGPATTSCCSTIPMPRAASSSRLHRRPLNSISGT